MPPLLDHFAQVRIWNWERTELEPQVRFQKRQRRCNIKPNTCSWFFSQLVIDYLSLPNTGDVPGLGAVMITADNLNLDVLEQIFHFLSEHDLPSIALVNQSFSAAVVSRLYKTISFRLRHSKGYLNASSIGLILCTYLHSCEGGNNVSFCCHYLSPSPCCVRSTYR